MSVDRWDQRQLCPDGGCVGVIGPTGTCKVCGRAAPSWGDERKRGLVEAPEAEPETEPAQDADDAEPDDASKPATTAPLRAPAGWNERQVCSDGACIGLIGPNGTCKVCGRPGERVRVPVAVEVERDYVYGEHDDDPDDDEDDDDEDDDDPDDDDDRDETSEHHDDEDDASEDEEDYADDDEDADDEDDEDDDVDPDEEKQLEAAASQLAPVAIAEAADAERKLCPDGACVGVIGPDGRCKICGKATE